jgi:hypothetical protein
MEREQHALEIVCSRLIDITAGDGSSAWAPRASTTGHDDDDGSRRLC